jgi:ATP/maltotriose-dependent transcriptional regulator MalT
LTVLQTGRRRLLAALASFGKTTLLGGWLEHRLAPSARLAPDERG